MDAIVSRPDCLEAFLSSLHDSACRLLVFYGPGGVGKSVLLEALAGLAEVGKRHAICDLRRSHPGVSPDMLGPLYSLCDSVERAKLAKFFRFDLAQQVFSAKTGQPPRAAESSEFGWEMAGYVEGIVSAFSSVPGLGTGVQTAQLAYRAYRRLKPRTPQERQLLESYRAMQADELARAMPAALAQDIEDGPHRAKGRRILFLDNLERLSDGDARWLAQLVEATPSLLWVAFSRRGMDKPGPWARLFPVRPLDGPQRAEFWKARLPEAGQEETAAMDALSEGLPFYMDLLARRYRERGPGLSWDPAHGAEGLIERMVEDLTPDQREMVRALAAARRFGPSLFRALFPGKSFWAHASWLESPLFEPLGQEGDGPVYAVRRLYADAIEAACLPQQWQEYHQRLFQYYDDRLTGLEAAGPDPAGAHTVASAFLEFRHHAWKSGCGRYYLSRLVDLSDLLIRSGQGPVLLDEFRALDQTGRAMDWCGEWGLLCCLGQEARLCLGRGRYAEAASVIRRGLALASEESWLAARLHLLSQQTKLHAAAPLPGADLSERLSPVAAGEAYLDCVERNAHRLSAAEASRRRMDALAFLGKQYLTVGREDDAEACLTRAVAEGGDRWKAQAFGTYRLLALSQERLGELRSTRKDRAAARALYAAALESYTLAEYTMDSVDWEQTLDHGLAHKRMAENDFHLGDTEAGLRQLDAALERYAAVAAAAPELVDLYCKTGWACMAGAEHLLGLPGWQAERGGQVEAFLERARQAAETGLEWEQDYAANPNDVEAGSRQLRNLRAAERRLRGTYLEGMGRVEEAQIAYEEGMDAGKEAAKAAPGHPYSHLVLAECALALAGYLARMGADPGPAVREGLDAIHRALELSPGQHSFLELQEQLEGLTAVAP